MSANWQGNFNEIRDLRFSQQCWWRFKSWRTWCCVTAEVLLDSLQ